MTYNDKIKRMFELCRKRRQLQKECYGDAMFHIVDFNNPREKELNDIGLEICQLQKECRKV